MILGLISEGWVPAVDVFFNLLEIQNFGWRIIGFSTYRTYSWTWTLLIKGFVMARVKPWSVVIEYLYMYL